jgi:hypothetical protein
MQVAITKSLELVAQHQHTIKPSPRFTIMCPRKRRTRRTRSPQDEACVLLGFGFLVSEHQPFKQALHPQMFHRLRSVADLDSRTPKSDPAACIAVTKTCRCRPPAKKRDAKLTRSDVSCFRIRWLTYAMPWRKSRRRRLFPSRRFPGGRQSCM